MTAAVIYRRSECHGPKWEEFIKVFTSGQRFEVDEEMWDYWLEVLPPVFMYKEIDYFPGREGIPTMASFGFVEGADYITVFWVEGPKHDRHLYGQRSNRIARGR